LYLREGKLIPLRHRTESFRTARVEVFWLCGKCDNRMTLKVTLNGEINLIPKTGAGHPANCGSDGADRQVFEARQQA
jgi:hypothetical protein